MKKFIVLMVLFLAASVSANAESRYFTVQYGIPAFRGWTPTGYFVASSTCDPFMVKIDGVKYYMMFGGAENPSSKNLLGCSGRRKMDFFAPLRALDSDGDYESLTADELRSAGIRFVAADIHNTLLYNDKSKDFDMNKVDYIDMTRLRVTPAAVGYGNFDLYIKDERGKLKKIIGKVSVAPKHWAERMFD